MIAGLSLTTLLLILLAGVGAGFVGYAVGASSLAGNLPDRRAGSSPASSSPPTWRSSRTDGADPILIRPHSGRHKPLPASANGGKAPKRPIVKIYDGP